MDVLKSHLKETHGFTRFEMPNFELQENLKKKQKHLWFGFIAADIKLSTEFLEQKKLGKTKASDRVLIRFTFSTTKELYTLSHLSKSNKRHSDSHSD